MSYVLEIAKKRRSIRKFLDLPVEWDKVVQMLEAGRYAPAAGNLQSYKIIIVSDKDLKRKVAEAALKQYWVETAPILIVICAKPERVEQYYGERGRNLYMVQMCAAVAENMLLTATDLGLATCWVGAFDEDMVSQALGIPARATPHIILAVGYSNEKVPVPPRDRFESMVWLQKYNNRIKNLNMVMWDWSLQMEETAKDSKETMKKTWDKLKVKINHKIDEIKDKMKKDGVDPE